MTDILAHGSLLDTIIEMRRQLAILRARVDVVDSWLDVMERQVSTSFNKEYTNQDGPSFDPSDPAPERNKP